MKEAKDPVVTLKATAKEFNFSKLRADQDNKLANSGETMFLDFQRMNFIINGKEIDKNLLITLKEGAQDYESELFSKKDDIYNPESEKKREIDTDQGRAFVDSVLKELNQNRLPEIWKNHCNNPDIADHQKTDTYKKEFERFYNVGKEHNYLLLKKGEKNYRPFVKEVFKEMFKYAEAEVPSDAILEELATNCNQAGYGAGIFNESHAALSSCSLTPHSPKKALNIYCTDHNRIKVTSDMAMPITTIDNPEEKICDLSSSLEFTLESQDGKDSIIYKEGKLLLTIPKELKDYKNGGKNLFDIIKEHFQTFFERLGFKFETKIQIEHDLGTSVLDGAISTIGSDANKEFISLLEKNLKDELLKLDDNKEDIDAYVEVKVPTVSDLLSNYAKLEDSKENRELLIKEVADNLGLSSQNYDNGNSFALRSLPSLVKDQVNYEQAQFVANIFTKLIIEGKSEVYEKQGAINAVDAINRKIDGKIIEQEEKATNKQDIENDKWTDRIKKQRLSVESHEHLH